MSAPRKAPPPLPPTGAKPKPSAPGALSTGGPPARKGKFVPENIYADLFLPEVLPKDHSVFTFLPNTVWWRIISFLNQKDWGKICLVSRRWKLLTMFQMVEVDLSIYDSTELDHLLNSFQPPRESKNVGSVFSKKTARLVVDQEEKVHPIVDLMQFLSKTGGAHTIKLPDNVEDSHLSHLKNPRSLKKLSLEGCTEITNAALENLPRNIKILELNGCSKLTDDGLKSINSSFSRLEELSLAQTNISDDGIKRFGKQLPPTLKSLSLWNCTKITDASISLLPPTITTLSLRKTKITDACLPSLSKAMVSLDLSGTKITDAGMNSLPPNLRTLVLYYNGVTDKGVCQIPGLKNIFHLDIRTTKVDANGAKKIQSMLVTPDAELLHESVPPPSGVTVGQ